MSYDNNVYDTPEAFGLEIVAESVDAEASWSFDTIILWRERSSGRLLIGADSGCSCPTPFEHHTVADLTPVISLQGIRHFQRSWEMDATRDVYRKDWGAFLDSARNALREKRAVAP